MVAPLIIVAIIGIIGAVLLITPAGEVVKEVLQQSGLTDPEAMVFIEDEEELEQEIVGGFCGFVHEMVDVGGDLGNDSIDASEFEGNPIGMTEEEAVDINVKGNTFFHTFTDMFCDGHAWLVSLINGLSPVEMGIAIVSIIALLVSLVLMMGHMKHMGKHWVIIIMVISFVVLFMIVIGGQASI